MMMMMTIIMTNTTIVTKVNDISANGVDIDHDRDKNHANNDSKT